MNKILIGIRKRAFLPLKWAAKRNKKAKSINAREIKDIMSMLESKKLELEAMERKELDISDISFVKGKICALKWVLSI